MEHFFSPKSDEDQEKVYTKKWNHACSQKFAMEGVNFWVWGRSLQPPKANGGWGSGGEAPSRRKHGGLGAEPPALENFAFFCKNSSILELFQ